MENSDNKSNRNVVSNILCFLVGFSTYYLFSLLFSYANDLIVSSPIATLYFSDFLGLFSSTFIQRVLAGAFYVPIEAFIVVLLITILSYFIVKPNLHNKFFLITFTITGAIFSDLFRSVLSNEGFLLSYFPLSVLFSFWIALFVNALLWCIYCYFAYWIVVYFQKFFINWRNSER